MNTTAPAYVVTAEQRQRRNAERYAIDAFFNNNITDWAGYVDVQRNSDGTVGTVQVTPTRDGLRVKVYSGADPALVVSQMLVRWDDLQATA